MQARRPDEQPIYYHCHFCGEIHSADIPCRQIRKTCQICLRRHAPGECRLVASTERYLDSIVKAQSDTPPVGDGRVSRCEDGSENQATLWIEVIEHRHSPVIAPASANNKVFPVDDIVPHIQSVRLDTDI